MIRETPTQLQSKLLGPTQFSDPQQIALDALADLEPKELQSIADWSIENRVLTNPGGYTGPLTWEAAPYLQEPHEALEDPTKECVAIAGPGQSGKTTVAEDWFAWTVDQDPMDLLWFMHTKDGIESYVKDRIVTIIETHDLLKSKSRGGDSIHMKMFEGMVSQFLWASFSNLINKRSPRIVVDEVDNYDPALGDIKTLVDVRRQTFDANSMLLILSHPDLAIGMVPERHWNKGIMSVYKDSDRRTWWWPCLSCGDFVSPNPGTDRYMELTYDKDWPIEKVELEAGLLCPVCGSIADYEDLYDMNQAGFWIGLGQEIMPDGVVLGERVDHKNAGFWITGSMSPFTYGGWGGIARDMVNALRTFEIESDDGALREVTVKRMGFPYRPRSIGELEPIDETTLRERSEDFPLAMVPPKARFLVAVVDVQGNRFVVQVEAVGPYLERWLIDRFEIKKSPRRDADGDPLQILPATVKEDWLVLETEVIERKYPLDDGSDRYMHIAWAGCDSQGEDGVTTNAYDFWRYLKTKNMHRRFRLLRGEASPRQPLIRETFPDSHRKDRKASARGEVPVIILHTDKVGDSLSQDLKRKGPGPGRLHLPRDLPANIFQEFASEIRTDKGWERLPGIRNEAWDLGRYAKALLFRIGVERVTDWEKPPHAFMAPWHENPLVSDEAVSPAPKPPGPARTVVVDRSSGVVRRGSEGVVRRS